MLSPKWVSCSLLCDRPVLGQGQLVVNYYGTSHASLGNYLSQVSGQASTPMINNDCIDLLVRRAAQSDGDREPSGAALSPDTTVIAIHRLMRGDTARQQRVERDSGECPQRREQPRFG